MAVDGVEIDEIGEDQAPRRRIERALDFVHAVGVARRVDRARDAAAGEEILDLADGDDRRARHPVSMSRSVGANGVSAKSRRFAVRWNASRSADKRPGDHAADAAADAHQIERDLADRYNSGTGTTSSCAAIWKTLSADV